VHAKKSLKMCCEFLKDPFSGPLSKGKEKQVAPQCLPRKGLSAGALSTKETVDEDYTGIFLPKGWMNIK
jgi:hypothetical protein